jgi:hypothetical protein
MNGGKHANQNGSKSKNVNGCFNCQLVGGELALMKAELAQLRNFLGNKLTLMEGKLDTMALCLATSNPQ